MKATPRTWPDRWRQPNCDDEYAPAWDGYASWAQTEYNRLINSKCDEAELQIFLERNPALVPADITGVPLGGAKKVLFTQPLLDGSKLLPKSKVNGRKGVRKPDFAWMIERSDGPSVRLVEIESPKKQVFTSTNCPTARFTQAFSQLVEWKVWSKDDAATKGFAGKFLNPFVPFQEHPVHFEFRLYYGRSCEFESRYKREWRNEFGHRDEIRTLDSLQPVYELRDAITVKRNGRNEAFEIVGISPTASMDLVHPKLLALVPDSSSWKTAIDNIGYTEVNKARKDYLKRHIEALLKYASSRTNTGQIDFSQTKRAGARDRRTN